MAEDGGRSLRVCGEERNGDLICKRVWVVVDGVAGMDGVGDGGWWPEGVCSRVAETTQEMMTCKDGVGMVARR